MVNKSQLPEKMELIIMVRMYSVYQDSIGNEELASHLTL